MRRSFPVNIIILVVEFILRWVLIFFGRGWDFWEDWDIYGGGGGLEIFRGDEKFLGGGGYKIFRGGGWEDLDEFRIFWES